MALPSQTARTSSTGRVSMFRRKRSNPRTILLVAGAILSAGALIYLLRPGSGQGEPRGTAGEDSTLAAGLAPAGLEAESSNDGGVNKILASGPTTRGFFTAGRSPDPARTPDVGRTAPGSGATQPGAPKTPPADEPAVVFRMGERRGEDTPSAGRDSTRPNPSEAPGGGRPAGPTDSTGAGQPASQTEPGQPTKPVLTPQPSRDLGLLGSPPSPATPTGGHIGGQIGGQPGGQTGGRAGTGGTPPPASLSESLPADLRPLADLAGQRLASGDAVSARSLYSKILLDPRTLEGDRTALRTTLTQISADLVFSPRLAPGDAFVDVAVVGNGEGLERLNRRMGLSSHWKLIQRVNRIAAPNRVSPGQKLKIVRGPFHAIVSKSAYRLDLFMGDPQKPAEWVYTRSFPVGLGADDGTPLGTFVVRKNSKLENPHWVNPRTGERFSALDPKNPIGEHWIGLEGVGASAASVGYGLHGTIEPDSIGEQRSMGCIRLLADDIALVYEALGERVSVVKIVP